VLGHTMLASWRLPEIPPVQGSALAWCSSQERVRAASEDEFIIKRAIKLPARIAMTCQGRWYGQDSSAWSASRAGLAVGHAGTAAPDVYISFPHTLHYREFISDADLQILLATDWQATTRQHVPQLRTRYSSPITNSLW
jgi:hypothetical protein